MSPQPAMQSVQRLHLQHLEVVDLSLLETFCGLRELRLQSVATLLDRRPIPAAVLSGLRSAHLTHCKLHSIPQARPVVSWLVQQHHSQLHI